MTEIKKENKNMSNVPNLRFPEFKGEWEVKKLGDLSELITKGTTPKKFVSQGIKFIKIECFDGDTIDLQKCLFIEEQIHNKELKRSILKENDLLFAIAGATIGKINIIKGDILPANTNQALAIIRLKEKENSKFIYQILKSEIMQRYIKDSISVGAQPNLNLEQMNNFSFFYPSLSEQQKLSSFLSLIDKRIQTQNKIIEELKILKATLSHKIFSRQLRFQDDNGKEFCDWEIKKLGDLVKFCKGSNLSKGDISIQGQIKCIHYGELFTIYNEVISSVISRTNNVGFYSNIGDILMPSSDVTPLGLATASTILENGVILGGDINVLRPSVKINSIFLSYLINYEKKKIIELVSGTTIKHIYSKDLKVIKLNIPNSVDEQTKIAEFLSQIDKKVETEKQLLTQYENQKKYLLQNLFI